MIQRVCGLVKFCSEKSFFILRTYKQANPQTSFDSEMMSVKQFFIFGQQKWGNSMVKSPHTPHLPPIEKRMRFKWESRIKIAH